QPKFSKCIMQAVREIPQMRIATFSSVWSSSTGGIDVFNMNLVRSLANVTEKLKVSACLQMDSDALRKDSSTFHFIPVFATSRDRSHSGNTDSEVGQWTDTQAKAVILELKLRYGFEPDVVVRHDVFCKTVIQEARRWLPKAKIVTFFHSAYGRSEKRKGRSDGEIERKISYQREMIEESDFAISVGSFSEDYLRSISSEECHSKIFSLPPGVPSFSSRAKRTQFFNAVSFGRLDPVSDTLKQIRLAARAWEAARQSGH